jgi:hypothetical protein
LANEVNRALKLTKTYWRKARRRQDYDARADQDHMELHEWLQQLKDKTMSHLELLMQKGTLPYSSAPTSTDFEIQGDITGPPYNMPDDMELTFLRNFVERQNAGIPHNPRQVRSRRLRDRGKASCPCRLRAGADRPPMMRNHIQSPTPEPTDNYYPQVADFGVDRGIFYQRLSEFDRECLGRPIASSSRTSISPMLRNFDGLSSDGITVCIQVFYLN